MRHGFAVGVGVSVNQCHDVAAKSELLIAECLVGISRLPEMPDASLQFLDNPAVNTAAPVVPQVEDQSLALEYWIKLAGPARNISGAHGLQMHIFDAVVAGAIDDAAALALPREVAQLTITTRINRRNDHIARFPAGILNRQ